MYSIKQENIDITAKNDAWVMMRTCNVDRKSVHTEELDPGIKDVTNISASGTFRKNTPAANEHPNEPTMKNINKTSYWSCQNGGCEAIFLFPYFPAKSNTVFRATVKTKIREKSFTAYPQPL